MKLFIMAVRQPKLFVSQEMEIPQGFYEAWPGLVMEAEMLEEDAPAVYFDRQVTDASGHFMVEREEILRALTEKSPDAAQWMSDVVLSWATYVMFSPDEARAIY